MTKPLMYGWCSWCHEPHQHRRLEARLFGRGDYRYMGCGRRTLPCFACSNMARGARGLSDDPTWTERWAAFFRARVFCANHDGSIASFAKLNEQLDDLANYATFFRREHPNLRKVTAVGGLVVGSVLICGPLAYLSAPAIAGALGASGVLGAASTGTAISSLSGAALQSASLCAIGGGIGTAWGTAFIAAGGAALGSHMGAVVSNAYFGDVRGFHIKKLKDGHGPVVLFVNGFLSEKDDDATEWCAGVAERYADNPWYLVQWESKTLLELGKTATGSSAAKIFAGWVASAAGRATRNPKVPLTWPLILGTLLANPWHSARAKAQMTGIVLADLLVRTAAPHGYVVMGNSLGVRVTKALLATLSTRSKPIIEDVYLLGGAEERQGWEDILGAVRGNVYNCYSKNDAVLRMLYRTAQGFMSEPVGLGSLPCSSSKVINVDVSDIVHGHMEYKANLGAILDRCFTASAQQTERSTA